jgi:hypothetical protein
VLKECLVSSSMRLGVPFIAPRQLGAVESNPGRQFLPSVAWRTGHCPMRISFLIWRSRLLTALESLAHRTVRCPLPTVGSATCLAWIAQPTVGPATVGSPDSPVNYSRTPFISSREQQVRLSQPGTPDTVRCTQTELALAEQGHLFSNSISPVSNT